MIKIEHLVKTYGNFTAVDDISFEVGAGEIVGFLGPNGAGKSTTMNMLTGYLSSTAGSIEIDGIDILAKPLEAKKRIGYLPEQPPLYFDMTVKEYLDFAYDLKGCRLDRKKHIDEIIGHLSKGYKQRVGIAQVLIGNPKVIIFDEPTIGLDPKQIIEIRNLIRNLGRDHTVILSTHILQEVQAVCDRIIIINKGQIVADEKTENITRAVETSRRFSAKICGPQREVLAMLREKPGIVYAEPLAERDGDAFTYMIESDVGIDIRKTLFYTLAERGWPLIGLESLGMSLEDIFITIVDAQGQKKNDKAKNSRVKRGADAERDVAARIMEKTAQSQKSAAKSIFDRRDD